MILLHRLKRHHLQNRSRKVIMTLADGLVRQLSGTVFESQPIIYPLIVNYIWKPLLAQVMQWMLWQNILKRIVVGARVQWRKWKLKVLNHQRLTNISWTGHSDKALFKPLNWFLVGTRDEKLSGLTVHIMVEWSTDRIMVHHQVYGRYQPRGQKNLAKRLIRS